MLLALLERSRPDALLARERRSRCGRGGQRGGRRGRRLDYRFLGRSPCRSRCRLLNGAGGSVAAGVLVMASPSTGRTSAVPRLGRQLGPPGLGAARLRFGARVGSLARSRAGREGCDSVPKRNRGNLDPAGPLGGDSAFRRFEGSCARSRTLATLSADKRMGRHLKTGGPRAQGLYDPRAEHDSCGFGFVVDIAGRASHDIVRDALTVLVNLEHRGATGSEKNTGDGAGITIQIPHRFLAEQADKAGMKLRGRGGYGTGMVFLPADKAGRVALHELVRAGGPAGRAAHPGLARSPHRQLEPGRQRQSRPTAHPPGLHRSAGGDGRGPGLRAQAVRSPAAGREGRLALGHPYRAATSTFPR